ATSRREFFTRAGSGLAGIALTQMLHQDGLLAASGSSDPMAPKQPHFPPKAKSIIWLFMEGGPSHVDLFDPKPKLQELAGQPLPKSFGRVITAMGEYGSPLLGSKRTWRQHGKCGTWASDWVPHTAECVDDIAVIRSCIADGL